MTETPAAPAAGLAAAVDAATAAYGTPCWLLDGPRVKANLEPWAAFARKPGGDVFMSVKANPAPPLLRAALDAGLGLDVASAFDVEAARFAGAPAERLSFCTRAIDDDDVARALECGVLVASSAAQARRWMAGGRTTLGLRVNTGVVAGFHAHVRTGSAGARFGVPIEEAPSVIADLRAAGAEIDGLHTHLGSDILDPEAHLEACRLLVELAAQVGGVRWVNLGGGYGIPFADEEPTYDLTTLFAGVERLARGLEIRFEPGAHIGRDAGWLVTSVLEVDVIDGVQHVTVDSSVNHLPGALLYGTQHPVVVVDDGGPSAPRQALIDTIVAGMLMQPGDVLSSAARLPPLRAGAVLAFGLAGAYTAVRASTFNGRPLPAEVWWNGSEAELVRRRRSPAELHRETYG